MPWLQLILECPKNDAERLSELLDSNGAAAVTFQDCADQPLYEPPPGSTPLWNNTRVTGMFPADADLAGVQDAIGKALTPAPAMRIEQLEDKDWSREWEVDFRPMRYGRKLWIVPSGHTPPDKDGTNILLDPGLAFGTGTHPTTRLCLEWLDEHGADGCRVIDYGCGSGILAIAAAKRNAREVWAVDLDPQALAATRSNADRNGLNGNIKTALPEELPEQPTDLLLANILALPLISLAMRFAMLVTTGGRIVLSGILPEQADDVHYTYQNGFEMGPVIESDGWVRLEGTRR